MAIVKLKIKSPSANAMYEENLDPALDIAGRG
jgi:hypothetical protein